MKICLLTHSLDIKDGEGRLSFDLISNLRKLNYEIIPLTNSYLLKRPVFHFIKIRKIFKNSDIIHAIDIWPNGFYARLISYGLKKPIVITALGTYSVAPFYSWRKLLMKWACDLAEIIAISDYTKKEINKMAPNAKVKVICPGFDWDFWSVKEIGFRHQQYKPYLLSVGALKFRKGYHDSIKALGILAKKFPQLNYVIIGQGETSDYAGKLKEIVKSNGLEGRVFFESSGIDDQEKKEFYANAELFELTPVEENNHFEGFGIVYLEAAASGLPIVATLNSGATSAVRDGYNGILVPQNNPEKIAGAISEIISSDTLKAKLKSNSREWAKKFDWSKIILEYIEIYNANIKHN